MVKNSEIGGIALDGGRVCLDFVNSVHDRRTDPFRDYLHNTIDLIAWGERAGILQESHAGKLEATALAGRVEGDRFFEEALAFRELMYRIFYGIIRDQAADKPDLLRFNAVLREYLSLLKIEPVAEGFERKWDLPRGDLRWLMGPIVMDAYELLLSDKLGRLKECPNCGWLFQDTSKNGKRKWCSMKACGSNVKALKWYHRNKNK